MWLCVCMTSRVGVGYEGDTCNTGYEIMVVRPVGVIGASLSGSDDDV